MKKSKTRQPKRIRVYTDSYEDRFNRIMHNLRHKDLQAECIKRGLSSIEVVSMDHHKLTDWLFKNLDNTQDEQKLIEHDAWVDEQLTQRGIKKGDALLNPALKFARPGNIEEMDKPSIIKPEGSNVPKAEKKLKAEISQVTGVRSGTKKALTFDLAFNGVEIGNVIKQVKDKFPEADEKSVRIWFKKAIKQKNEKEG